MNSIWKVGSSVLAAGVLLCSAWTVAPAGISVGDEVTYTFRDPLLNGMGVKSFGDLAGKPILVEFWGTR
jgi:hypothetical protein